MVLLLVECLTSLVEEITFFTCPSKVYKNKVYNTAFWIYFTVFGFELTSLFTLFSIGLISAFEGTSIAVPKRTIRLIYCFIIIEVTNTYNCNYYACFIIF